MKLEVCGWYTVQGYKNGEKAGVKSFRSGQILRGASDEGGGEYKWTDDDGTEYMFDTSQVEEV